MRRREFISLLTGTAAAWPLAARAQQPAMPVIGFLHTGSPSENAKRLAAFLKGLGDGGFVDGRNVVIEYHWAAGNNEALPAMAAELVRRKVTMIVTPASTAAAVVARAATSTIPIVFAIGADPVALGLVTSLSRPGGNATGTASLNAEVGAKRLGLLRELVPQAARYHVLVNPTSPLAAPFIKELESGAASLGIHLEILRASNDAEIEARFAALPEGPGNVMVFGPDALFYTRRAQIAALAVRHAVPAIFDDRAYVEAGGLLNYGADWANLMELTGGYAARVLKGEKPADLPVQQATKFELVINLKTAKALGLAVPQKLLLLADDVVE
jgi:putative tryptophan/tyrosine transport system substrate-binding protein